MLKNHCEPSYRPAPFISYGFTIATSGKASAWEALRRDQEVHSDDFEFCEGRVPRTTGEESALPPCLGLICGLRHAASFLRGITRHYMCRITFASSRVWRPDRSYSAQCALLCRLLREKCRITATVTMAIIKRPQIVFSEHAEPYLLSARVDLRML